MLRLLGDTSFRTWWQCGNSGRIPNEQGATRLPEAGRHDHHSAVYQVLPEFRDLYEFALGWSDTEPSEQVAPSVTQPADEYPGQGDDHEYEQVDITSLLDAPPGPGELRADVALLAASIDEENASVDADQESALEQDHSFPSWWSVEPSYQSSGASESEQGLLVALAASVDVLSASESSALDALGHSEPPALEPATQGTQDGDALAMSANESESSREPAEVPDELVEFLKVLCAPSELDESPEPTSSDTCPRKPSDQQFVGTGNTSIWKEFARQYSEQQVDTLEPAEPAKEVSLIAPAASHESDTVDSGTATRVRQQGATGGDSVRTSLPLAPELISYAPLTRDAIGISLKRKPRRTHLGALLGFSGALLGIAALLAHHEFGTLNLELSEVAERGSENPDVIRNLAMLRVPPPTPVAFELLLPRPTIEPAKVESEDATPLIETNAPSSQATSSPPATSGSDASAPHKPKASSAWGRERQVSARHSEILGPEPRTAPVTAAFDAEAAQDVISKAGEQAQSCRDSVTPPGDALITVTFAPSGRVITTSVSGPPFAGTAAGSCIVAKLYDVRIQPFAATASVTLSRTLSIR